MPRSGTTWLARVLASARGAALTGREPMNPRGRQYALAGSLVGWTRMDTPTARQRRALDRSYSGRNPMVYSRYGHRQWAAAFPSTRVIVKDPFAMLSLPTIHEVTGATAVLLFRHPGAALASYRRMGWSTDGDEMRPIIEQFLTEQGPVPGVVASPEADDEVAQMAWFWSALYGIALHDVDRFDPEVVVLAHEDVATGGVEFGRRLFDRLDLRWSDEAAQQLVRGQASRAVDQTALHNLDRSPAKVAHEWETRITPEERRRLEQLTNDVHAELLRRAFGARG
jgi:hypothetical protein